MTCSPAAALSDQGKAQKEEPIAEAETTSGCYHLLLGLRNVPEDQNWWCICMTTVNASHDITDRRTYNVIQLHVVLELV